MSGNDGFSPLTLNLQRENQVMIHHQVPMTCKRISCPGLLLANLMVHIVTSSSQSDSCGPQHCHVASFQLHGAKKGERDVTIVDLEIQREGELLSDSVLLSLP